MATPPSHPMKDSQRDPKKSGRSAAWLARYLGVVEVVGSNPAGPIAEGYRGWIEAVESRELKVEKTLIGEPSVCDQVGFPNHWTTFPHPFGLRPVRHFYSPLTTFFLGDAASVSHSRSSSARIESGSGASRVVGSPRNKSPEISLNETACSPQRDP
jgi:hypothetical protein